MDELKKLYEIIDKEIITLEELRYMQTMNLYLP